MPFKRLKKPVAIAAQAHDIDGTIAQYQWLQTARPEVAYSGDNSDTLAFTSPILSAPAQVGGGQ